jgi:sugar phosphate isomerase/epimerase
MGPETGATLGKVDAPAGPSVRISVSTGSLYHRPLSAAFRAIRTAGAESVELVVGPEVWLRGAATVARLAARAGITIDSLHPPILPFPGWLDIPASLARLAALAVAFRARLLCVHPPDVGEHDQALADRFERALDTALGALKGTGVTLALENMAIYLRSELQLRWHDPARLLELAERHGVPLVYDVCHGDSWPTGLNGTWELLRGRTAHIHFSDVRGLPRLLDWPRLHTYFKHHQMPGEGRLPLIPWLRGLCGTGYAGALVLEISPTALGICPGQRLKQAVRWTLGAVSEATAPGKSA